MALNNLTSQRQSSPSPTALLSIPVVAALLSQPRHLLVLRLTLLLLLLYGSTTVFLDVPLRVMCGLMLLSPALLANSVLWAIVCGLVWWVNGTHWLWIDNHKILISYWCLVCALAVSAKDTDRVLAGNGQILIGLTFLLATAWKILAGEYWNGAFLHYTFLTDIRVEAVATAIGGLSPDSLPQNQILQALLSRAPQTLKSVTLSSSPRLEVFALVASYWTLVIEGSVAIAFLGFQQLSRFRDWLLMLFIVTTYFLLPVLGFAYVLIVMGFAQCPSHRLTTRTAYVCLFGFLQFARFPWDTLFV